MSSFDDRKIDSAKLGLAGVIALTSALFLTGCLDAENLAKTSDENKGSRKADTGKTTGNNTSTDLQSAGIELRELVLDTKDLIHNSRIGTFLFAAGAEIPRETRKEQLAQSLAYNLFTGQGMDAAHAHTVAQMIVDHSDLGTSNEINVYLANDEKFKAHLDATEERIDTSAHYLGFQGRILRLHNPQTQQLQVFLITRVGERERPGIYTYKLLNCGSKLNCTDFDSIEQLNQRGTVVSPYSTNRPQDIASPYRVPGITPSVKNSDNSVSRANNPPPWKGSSSQQFSRGPECENPDRFGRPNAPRMVPCSYLKSRGR